MSTSTSSLDVSTGPGASPSNVTAQPGVTFVPYVTRPAEIYMLFFLLIISLYLTVAASWYQWKHGQESLKWTNRLCTIAPSTLLLQSCLFLIEVCGTNLSDAVCSFYFIVTIFLLNFNKSFVYLVLWIRQHTFYTNPTATRSVPRTIWVISYSALVGMVVLPIGQVIFQCLARINATPVGRDYYQLSGFTFYLTLLAPVLFMLFVLVQFMLLGLVLYPIASHLRKNRSGSSGSTIRDVIVRLSICTGICVATDIGALIVVLHGMPEGQSMSFMPLTFSFNAIANVLFLYLSFTDKFDRLVPFKTRIHSNDPKNKDSEKGQQTKQSQL